MDRAKDLAVEISDAAQPWAAVRKAELRILRRLDYRVCAPTSRDILDRLLADALRGPLAWEEEPRKRCALLARFVLELGAVHEPEAIYSTGRPPLAAALAALLLARFALGAPMRECLEPLRGSMHLVESLDLIVADVAQAMLRRWSSEDMRVRCSNGSAGGGAVTDKWLKRGGGQLGVSPPAPGELQQLMLWHQAAVAKAAADGALADQAMAKTAADQAAVAQTVAVKLLADKATAEQALADAAFADQAMAKTAADQAAVAHSAADKAFADQAVAKSDKRKGGRRVTRVDKRKRKGDRHVTRKGDRHVTRAVDTRKRKGDRHASRAVDKRKGDKRQRLTL